MISEAMVIRQGEAIRGLRHDVDEHDEAVGRITAAISALQTDIAVVKSHTELLVDAYMSEHPSKVGAVTLAPRSSPPASRAAELKLGGLVTVIVVLVQLLAELAHRVLPH